MDTGNYTQSDYAWAYVQLARIKQEVQEQETARALRKAKLHTALGHVLDVFMGIGYALPWMGLITLGWAIAWQSAK